MQNGHDIDIRNLQGFEYRGTSLGLAPWVEKLSWKTFKKTFLYDKKLNITRGFNIRMTQTGSLDDYEPVIKNGLPLTFGHYTVEPFGNYRLPLTIEHGLLINYGSGLNSRLDFTARLKDPIVAIEKGNDDFLLGWSYLDLGFARFKTPSFFCLEKDGPISYVAEPARVP